jgi:hypothetical protein
MVNVQEVLKTQGTRLKDEAPWESYSAQFEEKLDPQLEEEINRYSENRHTKTSSQNQEELCRQKELSDEVAKEYQFLHPDEYKDEGPRIGRIMHSSELINTLRDKCQIRCFYREHPQPRKVTLLVSKDGFTQPDIACWVMQGFMPEYSIVRFDEHGVPLDEKYRGWRTPLLQMILKGMITEEVVNKVFGPATGPASKRYNSLLYQFRNRTVEII